MSLKAAEDGNEILDGADAGRGHSAPELAVNAGDRADAAGLGRELRHSQGGWYGIYDRFKFRVPLGDHGDVYDRYMMRCWRCASRSRF
jgi:NADH-quinone oxidoreductase subunit D